MPPLVPFVHETAIVEAEARCGRCHRSVLLRRRRRGIGAGASLLAHVYVGAGSKLGPAAGSPRRSVSGRVPYRRGTRLHASSSFGPGVVLGARVEVGARCPLGDRVQIGEGTKMDDMVSIAEAATIGRHTILVSYSHFEAGCAVGDGCLVAPDRSGSGRGSASATAAYSPAAPSSTRTSRTAASSPAPTAAPTKTAARLQPGSSSSRSWLPPACNSYNVGCGAWWPLRAAARASSAMR